MTSNKNHKETGVTYPQKVKQKTNTHPQETAKEFSKKKRKSNQYQQEIAQDFLNIEHNDINCSVCNVPEMNVKTSKKKPKK